MLVMGPLPRREVEKWKTNNHEIISGESGKGAGERREPERKKKDGCLSSPSPPPPSAPSTGTCYSKPHNLCH